MSWSKSSHASGKRGYHHGNLREALIEAARKLIAETGADSVTLAETARMAGVSAAAPYRHFKDRSTLMSAVAHKGFTRFADRIEKAWGDGDSAPYPGLMRIGTAYLEFVRQEPALYAAMFEAGVATSSDPDLARQSDRAFGVLKDACAVMHAKLPASRRAPPLMMALHIWSFMHGTAALFGRSDDARRPLPVPPEELLEAGILIYLDGLGFDQNR